MNLLILKLNQKKLRIMSRILALTIIKSNRFQFSFIYIDIPKSIKDIKKKKGNINFSYENYESKYDKLKHCIDQNSQYLNCLINEFT